MGKTVVRAVTAAATMGMSEEVRAGMSLAKAATSGGDIGGALADAASFGGASVAKGVVTGGPKAAALNKIPDIADVQDKVASLVSDVSDPLEQMRRRARTLLTGGLGVAGDESVVRKTLLGV